MRIQHYLLTSLLSVSYFGFSQSNGIEYLGNCDRVLTDGDWGNAHSICTEECNALINATDITDSVKIERLIQISNIFFDQEMYAEAIEYNIPAVNISIELYGDSEYTLSIIENLVALTFFDDNGSLLIEAGELLIAMSERLGVDMRYNFFWTHYFIGIEYNLRDQMAEAERSFKKALEISINETGTPDSIYAAVLISLSEVYSSYLKHEESISLNRRALSIVDSLDLPAYSLRANAYTMLMLGYSSLGDINNMIICLNGILALIDHLEPLDRAAKFVSMVIPLVNYDLEYGSQVSLDAGLDEVAKNFTAELDSANADPILLSSGYMAIGNIYLITQEYDSVYNYYRLATEVLEERYGTQNIIYMTGRNTMSICAELTGNLEHAYELLESNLSLHRQFLNENFSYLSEQEQSNILNDLDFNKNSYMFFFKRHREQFPQMKQQAVDFSLQMQGILLRNVTGLRNRVLQEGVGDVEKFDRWIALKEEAAAVQLSDAELAETLLEQAEEIEKDFNFQLKEFGGAETVPGWDSLISGLSTNEAAIQFLRYEHNGYFEPLSNGYLAIITRADTDQPIVVDLCTEDELLRILSLRDNEATSDYVQRLYLRPDPDFPEDSIYYQGDRLYNTIWEPLSKHLSGIDTIFYSPSGMLNRIALQAIPSANGNPLINQFVMVQRRFLPEQLPKTQTPESIAVAGGIRYSKIESELIAEADSDRGDNWTPLPGTMAELEFISSLCEERKLKLFTLSGAQAQEQDFRVLVKEQPDIIHIGTHGFFLDLTDSIIDQNTPGYAFRTALNPLQRSGLILAGGNDSWLEGNTGADDGILTASEIANLNLLNTQLVVLSACETGLGDIQGDEGVYGLQRAFALAGAEQMIMSLWKVPDRYTAELMQLFYTSLLNGVSPLESLRKAQLELAKKTGPYNWAAFVLVQ